MVLNKRIAVTMFTAVAVVLCTAETEVHAEDLEITHGPYLQHPAPDGMTIVWHTNARCVSKVEYGIGNELTETAISSDHGLIDNDRTSHIIRLTRLKPGTKYGYRAVSREFVGYRQQHVVTSGETVTGQTYQFTTLDPNKSRFSFCVVADHHERVDELRAMMNENSWRGVDFAVYNGDMVGDFMRPGQMFTSFIDASVEGFATNKPFVFVRGNHEMRGRYARNIPDFIPSFNGRSYFSFSHGSVHFIVLDTGEDKRDGHEYYNGLVDFDNYLKEESQWLEQRIKSPACRTATYRIVFCHIPLLPGGNYGAARAYENFGSLLNQAQADVVLSGHFHRLMHVPPVEGKSAYHQIVAPPHATSRVDITENGIDVTIGEVGGTVLRALSIARRRKD